MLENSGVEYRILGRTGLKVSSVGFGAMKMTDNSVLKRAFDLGVNYVDTADCYQGGNNEIKVGEAIKGKRKDVIVVTKVHPASEAAMMRSLDTSLSRLNVDYIDVMQLHNAAPKQISNPEVIRILTKMKDSGKIRFIGTSSHGDIEGCIYAAIKAQVYDMVLVSYNFESPQTVTDAIAKTAESGVGVVAMKTQAGGYKTTENITPHQAMLKWVLQNKNVATTIPGVVSISQIEEFLMLWV